MTDDVTIRITRKSPHELFRTHREQIQRSGVVSVPRWLVVPMRRTVAKPEPPVSRLMLSSSWYSPTRRAERVERLDDTKARDTRVDQGIVSGLTVTYVSSA